MKIYCKVCGMAEVYDADDLYKFGPHYFCGFWHWMTFIVKKYRKRRKEKSRGR